MINEVVFSPDGKMLASASDDGSVRLVDFSTNQLLHSLIVGKPIKSLSFSPDGTLLTLGTSDGKIALFRISDSHNIGALNGHTDAVTNVSFSNDGLLLASGSKDGTLRLWAVKP